MSVYNKATIRRAPHGDDKYFRMRKDTAQDENLSWEARGMIAYILSKPDTWDIQVHDLMQNCQKGRVYRILDELKKAGYLEDRKKYRDERNRWQWTPYILHERPITNVIPMPEVVIKEVEKSPYPDFRDTEKRDTVFGDTEKAEIKEQNTDSQNTDNNVPMENPSATDTQKPSINTRSAKQKQNDQLVEVLGKAFGVEAVGNDYGLYAKVANTLIKATIPMEEFPQYIRRLRSKAKEQGNWTVTIGSLIANGRPSEYVASRDKYQQQKQNAVLVQSGLTEAELHNLWMITGQRNEAS